MSRKHYRTLARIIKDNLITINHNEVIDSHSFIVDLCDMLKQDNSLFDKERFINACND